MERNEITANTREQEDQAMPPLIAFDKEKAIRYAKANTRRNESAQKFLAVLVARSDQHTKETSEETSDRSLEEGEVQGGCS